MISGWRASDAADRLALRERRVRGGAGDPVVRVLAALRRTGDGPAVEGVGVVLEGGRAGATGRLDVVDVDAVALEEAVAGVADRELDVAAGVLGQVEPPRLVDAAARPARRVPRAGRAGRLAALLAGGHVVLEERVPEHGAADARGRARVPVEVGQRGPLVRAGPVRLDEHEVPPELGVAVDPERELRGAGGHADRAREALVGPVGGLGERVLLARARRGLREEIGVDRVPVADAVAPVRAQVELADRGGRQVGGHRLLRDPHPTSSGRGACAARRARRWRRPRGPWAP